MAQGAAKPTIAITAGDPLGIGPEVTVKALDALRRSGELDGVRFVVYGHEPTLDGAARQVGLAPMWSSAGKGGASGAVTLVHRPFHRVSGSEGPTAEGGRHSFDLLACAIAACKRPGGEEGHADGIVTAPIAKEAWFAGGLRYPGHTEVLAEEFRSPRSAMLFVGPALRVILATTHIPLSEVARVLTTERVELCIELGARACRELGVKKPRVAVAGLNPHAGEAGILGEEDDRVIAPAVARARSVGVDVQGPLPGDTVFLAAAKGKFDLVVAMYHDQGLIPVKLLDREKAVNVTTGLEWEGRTVVRTSPAHGTAYDIAGKGIADPGSMVEAIRLAARMCVMARG